MDCNRRRVAIASTMDGPMNASAHRATVPARPACRQQDESAVRRERSVTDDQVQRHRLAGAGLTTDEQVPLGERHVHRRRQSRRRRGAPIARSSTSRPAGPRRRLRIPAPGDVRERGADRTAGAERVAPDHVDRHQRRPSPVPGDPHVPGEARRAEPLGLVGQVFGRHASPAPQPHALTDRRRRQPQHQRQPSRPARSAAARPAPVRSRCRVTTQPSAVATTRRDGGHHISRPARRDEHDRRAGQSPSGRTAPPTPTPVRARRRSPAGTGPTDPQSATTGIAAAPGPAAAHAPAIETRDSLRPPVHRGRSVAAAGRPSSLRSAGPSRFQIVYVATVPPAATNPAASRR